MLFKFAQGFEILRLAAKKLNDFQRCTEGAERLNPEYVDVFDVLAYLADFESGCS